MMLHPEHLLVDALRNVLQLCYPDKAAAAPVLQKTRKEFEGDYTLVCFPYTALSGSNPAQTATQIGEQLLELRPEVARFNVVNGFLNISLHLNYWIQYWSQATPVDSSKSREKVLIEYSSPNTNKPLHLGHIRNNLLGFSVARILEAAGKEVVMVNLINDRGIHICKSMLAWQKAGGSENPENTGLKGDHLVGKYYVAFDAALREETAPILEAMLQADFAALDSSTADKAHILVAKYHQSTGEKQSELKDELKRIAQNATPLMKEAQEMLRKWEAGDAETLQLWRTMNGWVYAGFQETYAKLGVRFDRFYYESETYLLGKHLVQQGLDSGVLQKRSDGSVWIDLRNDGLDEKLLLRSDGTSVYMTQDLGTALQRAEEYQAQRFIYVVGNEQDYHFKVLQLILQKMGYAWADGIYHLSYGMVDLPSGRMKSREGTVVDADDLIEEVVGEARSRSEELGKNDLETEAEKQALYETIGLAALKYFILKVDPKKRMVFNPTESIDINGNTGPFIQYTYARIRSVMRRATALQGVSYDAASLPDEVTHRQLLRSTVQFEEVIGQAADTLNPSLIANAVYDLAKLYNQFYHDFSILKESDLALARFRLDLSEKVADTLKKGMGLLGISMPERM